MTDYLQAAERLLGATRDRVLHEYGSAIGRGREELLTPSLVLDIDATRRNIELMATRLQSMSAGIRPHAKVHKSPDIARMQLDAGAVGLSMATVWEAAVMAAAGMDDLFVVNTVTSPDKIRVLAELARDRRVLVALDDASNAEALAAAARAAGSILGIMIEVNTGLKRCGVDTPEQALELARRVLDLKQLSLEGITGYEGHCSFLLDHHERHAVQQEAMGLFVGVAEFLAAHDIPCRILSAGGTSTWVWTANHPGITEIQAGTYVFNDNYYRHMAPEFEQALTVQATVISAARDRFVLDAGGKSVAGGEETSIVGQRYSSVRFHEEHAICDGPDRSSLKIGDSVQLVPGDAANTINLHDVYYVIADGRIADIWPVIPRGSGHHGLVQH
jgi:D-serine deaminase-like pyridoxal phosphate-dependent protein